MQGYGPWPAAAALSRRRERTFELCKQIMLVLILQINFTTDNGEPA